MSKPSKWGWIWIAWLSALVLIETLAQRSHHRKPRTLSEHIWKLFPRRFWRIVLAGLLGLLAWHLLSGPDVVPIAVLP